MKKSLATALLLTSCSSVYAEVTPITDALEFITSTLEVGKTVQIEIKNMNGCGLQWGRSIGNNERNAKFDCNNSGDILRITPTRAWDTTYGGGDPSTYIEAKITAQIGNATCGLEWTGGAKQGDNERNAKFDCSSSGDIMYLRDSYGDQIFGLMTTDHSAQDYICGLEWAGGQADHNNERNAKFDCDATYDPFTISVVGQ